MECHQGTCLHDLPQGNERGFVNIYRVTVIEILYVNFTTVM